MNISPYSSPCKQFSKKLSVKDMKVIKFMLYETATTAKVVKSISPQ